MQLSHSGTGHAKVSDGPSGPLRICLPLLRHTNGQTLCKGMSGSLVSTLSAEISSVIAMCTGTDMLSFPERYLCRKGRRWALPLPPSLSLFLSLSLSLSVSFPLSLTSPLCLAQLLLPRSLPFPQDLHLPGAELIWAPFLSLLPCPRKGARRKVKATVVPLLHGRTELNKEMDKGVWQMALNSSANAMQSQPTTMCPVCHNEMPSQPVASVCAQSRSGQCPMYKQCP